MRDPRMQEQPGGDMQQQARALADRMLREGPEAVMPGGGRGGMEMPGGMMPMGRGGPAPAGASQAGGASAAAADAAVLTGEMTPAITVEDVRKAGEILQKYKQGKANLEQRIIDNEQWYKGRHWEQLRRGKQGDKDSHAPEPSSAWLFNALMNKHADAMDNYPEPNVLPREESDQESAKALSSILPVVLEYNDFEEVYSDNWWEKLKHGTAVYGVFWNPELENGLGDLDIRAIDLLNIFWEPGISDIQRSRNLFIVDLKDNDLLEAEYPQLRDKLAGNVIEVSEYIHDDTVDTSQKSVVVDWYYKTRRPGGRTVLHYCKFVGETLLYASENDEQYRERGFYDHGEYPVVFDTLYPEKGYPCGFGYIAVTKDPQLYIDKLGGNIMENSLAGSKPRYFMARSTNVNAKQFLDWSNPIVEVEGQLDDTRLRPIETPKLDGLYINVLQMKIDELKETSANRDVSQGSTSGGVTAASAIAALQEAGNKGSRDMISGAYRKYTTLCYYALELMRQFYDETRSFRVVGDVAGELEFIEFSNAGIRDQQVAEDMYRRPVFDIKIKAQKRSPYSKAVQNETAKELYGMGFFNPQRAQEALGALEMMDFEGKDHVMGQVMEGQTLYNQIQQMMAQMAQMAMMLQQLTGRDLGLDPAMAQDGAPPPGGGAGQSMGGELKQAQTAGRTPMMAKLAASAGPDMSAANSGVGK